MSRSVHAAAFLLAFALLGLPAFGAGDGGGGGGGGSGGGSSGGSGGGSGGGGGGGNSGSRETAAHCAAGKVWDKKVRKCVLKSTLRDDDSIYETGRDLAYAGRYDEAIDVLTLARNKADPRVLNFLGYSHRKSGRIEVGLGYYQEALRSNPDYTLAREYLGEAHLQLGDVASAREQLREIEKRCGKSCSEYAELSKRIDAFVKG